MTSAAGKRTVYVVSFGDYSDRHVVAVRSSRSDAERIAALSDSGHVAEWVLDEEPMPAPDLSPWTVEMDRDGGNEAEEGHDMDDMPWLDNDDCPLDKPTLGTRAEMFDGRLVVQCWARGEEHAVKIANDIRAQRIASGEWKP